MVGTIFSRLAGKKQTRRTIGFYGADSGVGTTHLAIAAANYVAGEWNLPAAVIELGNHPCIRMLDADAGHDESFLLDGVRYYPQALPEQLPVLINSGCPYLIMDLGSGRETWQEFLRCDLRYLVASLSPWRIAHIHDFMNSHRHIADGKYDYYCKCKENYFTAVLTSTGNLYEKRQIQHMYHVPVRTIPWIADPFAPAREQLSFFQELL